jgi:PAT family beta-lactamase induction signal transducer AmpG
VAANGIPRKAQQADVLPGKGLLMAVSPLSSRLGLLLTLYICQGLPTGVFSQALPAILRRYDVPLTVIGMSGLLAIPFLWAPFVESHNSVVHVLPMQMLGVGTLLLIAFFDPYRLATTAGITQFFILMFMVNLFAATQDIATDRTASFMDITHADAGCGYLAADCIF